jgi:hypothetical protein
MLATQDSGITDFHCSPRPIGKPPNATVEAVFRISIRICHAEPSLHGIPCTTEDVVVGLDLPNRIGKHQSTWFRVGTDQLPSPQLWFILILTAAFTGMRSSELRALIWRNVDLVRRVIHVAQRANRRGEIGPPKSKAGYRDIPISNEVADHEKENLIYPIALANLILHGIDQPQVWHGNTLTGAEIYGGLFRDAPPVFDVVLTNPPFGGKEGRAAQTQFSYKTGSTQVLFLQHVIDSLKPGGRCGIVLDEGVLFRTSENAFVQTKRKLLDECEIHSIVSLPPGVFVSAGAAVK